MTAVGFGDHPPHPSPLPRVRWRGGRTLPLPLAGEGWGEGDGVSRVSEISNVVPGVGQIGKEHARIAETTEIADAHRVKLADQMVAFVLHHARMKAFGLDRKSVV